MLQNLTVSKSIEIDAPPAEVWEALTNPEMIKKYLFGTETITDWKIGSEIIFQGDYQGTKYRDKGLVVENNPKKALSYKYWSAFSGLEDKPENYSLVSYNLKPLDDDGTIFTWTQKGFANEEGYKHSEGSMDSFLQTLKGVIEGEEV